VGLARSVVGMNLLTDITPLVAGSHWDHDGFWWLPVLLLWATVLGLGTWFVVRTLRTRERSGTERASDIVAERYARGELSAEEYRERLEELTRNQ
jgi:putative membrane protein